jgi:tetratricopeptide (TPR) repeat protein
MSNEDRLVELLERWEAAATGSPSVTPEDFCRDCPDLLGDFRKLLGRLGPVRAVLEGEGIGELAPDDFAPEGGRYRPLNFHARGGLGVVFLAEDGEVGRNVALKCMQRFASADPDARRGFLAEAELTGRLEHPGVVPVYGLGTDPHGRPYYAMRFIRGETLGDAVKRFHGGTPPEARNVELRRLLRHFVAVCETMAFAHSRGVIHRDLKPTNVMVGEFGETLVVDWGLAKQLDKRADARSKGATPDASGGLAETLDESGSTFAGCAKGTPAFMPPEQAAGDWPNVGPAADVYSLGATLYAILTGKNPFQGGTALEVIEKVKAGRFAPPRAVNPLVPKPLEAVCLKAMALGPQDRYAGAKELAADVERWLADEPVSAWREPFALRVRRWLKRHRTLVTASVAALVVSCAGLGALAAQERRKFELEQAKNKELHEANERVEKNFGYARGAVKEMVQLALGNPLLRKPGMTRFQEAVLKKALEYYENFLAAQKPDDPEVQEELAQAHFFVAVISQEMGAHRKALDEYQKALAVLDQLEGKVAPSLDRTVARAATLVRFGAMQFELGDVLAGLDLIEAGIDLLERLHIEHPERPEFLAAIAVHLAPAASIYEQAGRPEAAAAALVRAEQLVNRTVTAADDLKFVVSGIAADLAVLRFRTGDIKKAVELSDRSEALIVELTRKDQDDPELRTLHWLATVARAEILAGLGRGEEIRLACETAREGLRNSSKANPDLVEGKRRLGQACQVLGQLHRSARRLKDAADCFAEARALSAELLGLSPASLDFQLRLGNVCLDQAGVLRDLGRHGEGWAALDVAERQFTALLEINPVHPLYRRNLAAVRNNRGIAYLRISQYHEVFPFGNLWQSACAVRALPLFVEAEASLARLMVEQPGNALVRDLHAITLRNVGIAQSHSGFGKARDGFVSLERARDELAELAAAFPEAPEFAKHRDLSLLALANALSLAGAEQYGKSVREGCAFFAKAQHIVDELRGRDPAEPEYRDLAVRNLFIWCLTLRMAGQELVKEKKDFAAAIPVYEEAAPLVRKLHALAPFRKDCVDVREGILAFTAVACLWRCEQLDLSRPEQKTEVTRLAEFGLAALREWNPSTFNPQYLNARAVMDGLNEFRAKAKP